MAKKIPDAVRQQVIHDVKVEGMTQSEAARKNGVSQYYVCSQVTKIDFGAFPPYSNKD